MLHVTGLRGVIGLGLLLAGAVPALADPPLRPLEVLRDEIDRVDRDLLKLLNERAGLVGEVGRGKADAGASVFRPGRQAALIRRLAGFQGAQTPAAIARIWTAIIAGSILQQKPGFTVAVADAGDGTLVALAEDYFGAQPGRIRVRTPAEALAALAAGTADVAVIGLGEGPWWAHLPQGIHVVAAAPFVSATPEAPPRALIVARQEPDPSGDDVRLVLLPAATGGDRPALATGDGVRLARVVRTEPMPADGLIIGLYAAPLAPARAP